MLPKINIQLRHRLIEMLLVFLKGDLISEFKAPVIIWSLLHSIICEMDDFIKIFQVKFSARSSQIAVIIRKTFQIGVDRCYNGKASNIKFSIFVKSWIFNVSLHYKRSGITPPWIKFRLDFRKFSLYGYAYSSVGVFSWFDDPNIL